jgi:hypothetical protein
MSTPVKLGAYALGLAVVFATAVGVGRVAGPAASTATAAENPKGRAAQAGGGHGGGGHEESETAEATGAEGTEGEETPGGLQIAQRGYRLVPETTMVAPGKATDFHFTVTGPDGRPVTRYTPTHDKELHLIVVRRDLTGFQHLHPVQEGEGVWSVPLTLPAAGPYRVFADFQPEGAEEALTLGMDLTAPGIYQPKGLLAPGRSASVDGYTVTLDGDLVAGQTSKLTLSVRKDGKPVTDLQPYLAAYGHLVVLRDGDLAYLHVHPEGEPGDGRTRPGPDITFYAEVPSAGVYRMYLDFQHQGTVRTAEFTAVAAAAGQAGGQPPAAHGHAGGQDGGHDDANG